MGEKRPQTPRQLAGRLKRAIAKSARQRVVTEAAALLKTRRGFATFANTAGVTKQAVYKRLREAGNPRRRPEARDDLVTLIMETRENLILGADGPHACSAAKVHASLGDSIDIGVRQVRNIIEEALAQPKCSWSGRPEPMPKESNRPDLCFTHYRQ